MLCVALLLSVAWYSFRPVTPPSFYSNSQELAVIPPGFLLKHEVFGKDVPEGAVARKILYKTTLSGGEPVASSALVMFSKSSLDVERSVVAWAHGTTGAVPGCGPSLLERPFANVPALRELLAEGWIFVATDYPGLATPGPSPYLIGETEGRSVLDAVRAARQIPGLNVSEKTVVWGHSQGGHAALWAGILAASYAHDVPLAGVAAFAPATDLVSLLEAVKATPIGRILTSYVLYAYDSRYEDIDFSDYSRGVAGAMANDIAGRCLEGSQGIYAALLSLFMSDDIFFEPKIEGAFLDELRQNTPPLGLIRTPLFVAQGLRDELVLPDVQEEYFQAHCEPGQSVEYRRYENLDHLSLVASGSPLADDLIQWTTQRLSGVEAPQGCVGL